MPGDLLSLLAGLPDTVRYALAAVTTVVLVYWTARRLRGDSTDPSISLAGGDGSGYASFLLSGFVAVAFVAGGWILGLGPEIQAEPALAVIPLAFVVVWVYFEEREEA